LVKKPITASAAWSVPITRPWAAPAMVYWATMRIRALVLPSTKSTDTACLPSNAATSLASDLTAGPMFTVWRSSGDEVHRGLGVVFIELGFVRQAHGDELVGLVAGALAQFTHGALGQQAGGQRVDAAADAQHQGLEAGIDQAVLDKGDAPGDFGFEGLMSANGGWTLSCSAISRCTACMNSLLAR
jgi:hypothetical protein